MSNNTQRRLAAIVSADVVGYSRLMGVDETGTLADLRAHRAELIDALITEHGGRIVKVMGDGLLLEYPSVVAATQCMIEIQQGMVTRNQGVDEARRMVFRIGINLGDIIIEGEDILGDGVNIAARLQEIAEPGGIAVSDRVHEDIRDRLEANFEDAGRHTLKNIARPVHVWRWSAQATAAEVPVDEPLSLPDKPSIAVLPFDNMSGDEEQEYFADGIAEDIISTLSRLPWFFVISRNSSFSFKGRSTDVRQMAQELGVQYVLEGSVRKAGSRVRITAQLIDARNDRHIWAERYDRELTDIFAVQDEITEKIVGAVSPEFMAAEMHRARNKAAQNLDAWDLLMQAHWHLNQYDREGNIEAQKLLRQVITLDPNNDLALSDLAFSHFIGLMWGWFEDPAASLKMAEEAARKAVIINERNVTAWMFLGRIDIYAGRHDDAIGKGRKALDLAPNSAESHGWMGGILMLSGERDAAISELELAIRLSPRDPFNALWYAPMSVLHFLAGRYEESIGWCKKSLQDLPNAPPGVHRPMAASYAMLDRMDEARNAIEALRSRIPNVSIATTRQQMPFRREADTAHFLDALRKAGLPE